MFFKVLEHIRLPLLSHSYLSHVIEALDVVKEYPGCQEFISAAKECLLVPHRNTGCPRCTTGSLRFYSSYFELYLCFHVFRMNTVNINFGFLKVNESDCETKLSDTITGKQ